MNNQKSPVDDSIRCDDSPESSANHTTKHVVIVMDGMKEFTTESLEWALDHVIDDAGCIVTLLGAMPWLNIPLSSKVWLDVWPMKIEDLSMLKEKRERRTDVKYLKLEAVIELCKKYGVVLQKKVVMGYPLRLRVVEQIISLHPTLVVFDRNYKGNRSFYKRKIPCNMVMMNEDGEVEIFRGKTMFGDEDSVSEESPACWVPAPKLMVSEQLKEKLKELKKSHEEALSNLVACKEND